MIIVTAVGQPPHAWAWVEAQQPGHWALLANKSNKDLQQYTSRMIKRRRNTPVLHGDNFQAVLKDGSRHLFAHKRWDNTGGVIVIVANLEDTPAGEFTISDTGLEDGTWHEHDFNYDVQISGGGLKDTLGPSEVRAPKNITYGRLSHKQTTGDGVNGENKGASVVVRTT